MGAMLGTPAQHALEGMRVSIHQAWKNSLSSKPLAIGKIFGSRRKSSDAAAGIGKDREPGLKCSSGVNQVR